MRKFFRYLTVMYIIMCTAGQAAMAQTYGKSEKANEILTEYKVNTAFQPGEELIYELKYGIVKGGELKINVYLEPVGYDWMFHVVAKCYTTGVVSKLSRVNDIYESWFDICTGLPIKAIRNVTENNYKRYNEDLFFQDSSVVYSMKSGRHQVTKNTFDLLSAFFYARRFVFDQEMMKNQNSCPLNTWFNEDFYNLTLKYKDHERVKTNFGKIDCVKYVPIYDVKSNFKKEDDMTAWFSNDGNFVPIKIRLKMPVADIHCELISFKNLKNPDGPLQMKK